MMASEKTQQLVTGARRQKAIVEFKDPGWLVMHDDGQIEEWDTPDYALRSIQKRANRGNKTVTITIIEWRNTREGFKPPSGDLTTGRKKRVTR